MCHRILTEPGAQLQLDAAGKQYWPHLHRGGEQPEADGLRNLYLRLDLYMDMDEILKF